MKCRSPFILARLARIQNQNITTINTKKVKTRVMRGPRPLNVNTIVSLTRGNITTRSK